MKKKINLILTLVFLLLSLYGCNNDNSTDTKPGLTNPVNSGVSDLASSKLEIYFLDIGQGDCTILTCGGQTMLIDAGENDKGGDVTAYLKSMNINTLDIVVGTHNDSDHIGGLDVCLYHFDCKNVILSKYAKDNKTYDDVVQICKNKNYKIQYPDAGTVYNLGDATVTILSNPDYKANSANDSSISLLVTHHNNTFLFTGDSEEAAEYELLKNNSLSSVDVLQVGHHGSKSSTTDEFLDTVSPTYAIISCGENNSYGHPHAETLNKLRASSVKMFRTDKQGVIFVESDGRELKWNTSESDDWTPGEATLSSTNNSSTGNIVLTYILNTNTKKIHLEDCEHAQSIKDKNKETTTENIDTLIEKGYSRCKSCNP